MRQVEVVLPKAKESLEEVCADVATRSESSSLEPFALKKNIYIYIYIYIYAYIHTYIISCLPGLARFMLRQAFRGAGKLWLQLP